MAHTKGPWEVSQGHPDVRITDIVQENADWSLTIIAQDYVPLEEHQANTRLVAAAPELLEALEGVLRVADRKTVEFDCARAAIAKARGTP
jgi:hypothetical protein